MKNKKNTKKKFIKLFISFIILFIVFISLFYFINDNRNNTFSSIKNITDYILKITTFPLKKNNYICKNNTRIEEENKILRKEIENYKKELELKNTLTDKNIINASLIKRSMAYWYDTITIDKGSKSGIKVGYAAVNNNGLIGKVIKVNKNSSEIKLLSAKKLDNYISAMFIYNDNSYFGLIDGYDKLKNELHMKNVIGDFDDINDIYVTTSGLSDSFSKGIVIGKINRVVKGKYGISNDIYITPLSNFNDVSVVSVIGR